MHELSPVGTQLDDAAGASRAPLVLVVDDDPVILATLGVELRRAGYRVVEAGDAEEALLRSAEEVPAVVIADYCLPKLSGIELSARLNAADFVPIIFLSAFSNDKVVADALAEGAFVFLVKPIDPPQLLPVVRAALHRAVDLRTLWLARQSKGTLTDAQARTISVVTGLLMERFRISHTDAYHRLRQYARSQRLKIAEVATTILESSDRANSLLSAISSAQPRAGEPGKAPSRPLAQES